MAVENKPVVKTASLGQRIFYGWWMVMGAAFLNFFAGGAFFYGFTTFFNPIRQTFGWSAAVTSIAFTFQRLESGILGPIAGFAVDRLGPRRLMLGGWVVVGLGYFAMSRINSLWSFYGSFLLIATGLSFGSFVVLNAAVANWFEKKRSRALALIYVGYGASGLLVPLVSLGIIELGWRETLTIIGFILWGVGLPVSLLMRHRPGQYGYLPDGAPKTDIVVEKAGPATGKTATKTSPDRKDSSLSGFTLKEAMRTRAFWLISFVFFFQQLGTSAIMVHIVPSLQAAKVPATLAAAAVTGMTLSSLMGRFGFGFLGDFTTKRYLIAISLSMQIVGLMVLSFADAGRLWLVIVFLLIYGPGYGGPIPLRPALQADYFGTKNFGTIMGMMAAVTMLGGLASPVVAGWIFDVTGSYQLAWRIFALASIPSIPLMLLAKPPKAPVPAVSGVKLPR